MKSETAVEIVRVLPAPPDEVFSWWTDPERLQQWMSPSGSVEAKLDLRVGGAFRIVMRGPDVEIEHTGEYLEIDHPRRLVFTWRSRYTGAQPSVVTVEFDPEGTDMTLLRVNHASLPESAARSHGTGWTTMLDRLGDAVGRCRPGAASRRASG